MMLRKAQIKRGIIETFDQAFSACADIKMIAQLLENCGSGGLHKDTVARAGACVLRDAQKLSELLSALYEQVQKIR